jgi:hypothetical protein
MEQVKKREFIYYDGMEFILNVDLTKYDPNAKLGAKGRFIHGFSKLGDRFCVVKFENSKILLDILYDAIIPIENEEYEREYKEHLDAINRKYATAYDIIKYIGPYNEFKSLSYSHGPSDGSSLKTTHIESDPDVALKDIEKFKSFGKKIEIIKVPDEPKIEMKPKIMTLRLK